jgi:fatty acid desaturase
VCCTRRATDFHARRARRARHRDAAGGYPVLQSFTGYQASHVRDHHGAFGDLDRDPDYVHFQRKRLYREHLCRPCLRGYLWGLMGPRSTLEYVSFLLRHRMLTPDDDARETVLRLTIFGLVLLSATICGWLPGLFGYWLLPLVTTQVWIGSLAELLEHYPLMESVSRVDIRMSRNREFGFVTTLLLGEKRGEGYHLVHHLFPRVPLCRLHEAHELLLQRDPTYASLERPKSLLGALRGIYRALPEDADRGSRESR